MKILEAVVPPWILKSLINGPFAGSHWHVADVDPAAGAAGLRLLLIYDTEENLNKRVRNGKVQPFVVL